MTGPASDPRRIVREVVRAGYDRLDLRYRNWVGKMLDGPRAPFLGEVLRLIPPGSDVLEIGCGPGTDAVALAEGRRYTGIDLSGVQLAHARTLVPDGTFVQADVLEIELPHECFDAVVALYVFNHIPADGMPELFERISSWLRPGGWLCASFGTSDDPGAIEPMWLGEADMYFSSLPPERNDELLRAAGFTIISAETITEVEEDLGPATFHWVIARARADREALG
jgi:cyclopropane fatty-acyl-phospholipid synthase-like methyltransferase